MLALVRTFHTEISVNGERAERVLEWLRQKFKVEVFSFQSQMADNSDDELIDVNKTVLRLKMRKQLLAGFRLKVF